MTDIKADKEGELELYAKEKFKAKFVTLSGGCTPPLPCLLPLPPLLSASLLFLRLFQNFWWPFPLPVIVSALSSLDVSHVLPLLPATLSPSFLSCLSYFHFRSFLDSAPDLRHCALASSVVRLRSVLPVPLLPSRCVLLRSY